LKAKTILVPSAQAAEVVGRGEAELGVAQASEIVDVKGAQLVGQLPGDLGTVTVFTAGIGATTKTEVITSTCVLVIGLTQLARIEGLGAGKSMRWAESRHYISGEVGIKRCA
jgi:molybdate transport system substrate-binding protein